MTAALFATLLTFAAPPRLATLGLSLAALIPLAWSLWLALLSACSGALPRLPAARRLWRFDVVVPAHDEEGGIARTVRSLRAVDYPAEAFRVLVVADNCSDRTAEVAREASAIVIERHDLALRGKGYALEHAFAESRCEGRADAVVVVDADTVVSHNLLTEFAAHLEAGASAVQADYAVSNPEASWRTRLLRIALAMFHVLRSRGRERLRLSCGLRGNGMCLTHALLTRVPWTAFSRVEDVEYGLRLGEARVRVAYAGWAQVFGEMVSGGRAAKSQRNRWEGGRAALARSRALPLLRSALSRRDVVLLDLALDLLVPPLSTAAAISAVGCALALLLFARGGSAVPLSLWSSAAVCLCVYVVRGWAISGTGLRGVRDLLAAPAYLGWKLMLALRPAVGTEWVRTARETPDGPPGQGAA